MDVKKNRFDGALGKVYLQYSSPLHCFVEPDEEEAAKDMVPALATYAKKKLVK